MKSDLINGKPVKSIILFALPIMLSSMLQYNYNLVDNIIVGRFVGTDALAAVGNVGSINGFIIGTSLGLTSGFTISVAQAYGARKFDKMNKYAGNSITLAFVIGMVIMIVAHFLSRPLLKAIDTPDDIIDMSAQYIDVLYYAVPIQMSLNNFNALSRAVGDSKRPLYFLIVSVIVNLLLDILFVGAFKWGVIGAAWATAISELVAAVLSAISVLKYTEEYNIDKTALKIDGKVSWACSAILVSIGPFIVKLFMKEYNAQIMDAAMHYLWAIAECYSLVAVLFVFRNTLQGLGFTYANMIAGAGELFGRLAVALVFTPLIGFNAICYAGPVAWLLADIPLVIIYLNKKKNFKKLIDNQKQISKG